MQFYDTYLNYKGEILKPSVTLTDFFRLAENEGIEVPHIFSKFIIQDLIKGISDFHRTTSNVHLSLDLNHVVVMTENGMIRFRPRTSVLGM